MAKPLKVWDGTQWIEVALATPSGFATLASPAFTGSPTAPTLSVGTNNTGISTTAFVSATIDNEEILIIAGAW